MTIFGQPISFWLLLHMIKSFITPVCVPSSSFNIYTLSKYQILTKFVSTCMCSEGFVETMRVYRLVLSLAICTICTRCKFARMCKIALEVNLHPLYSVHMSINCVHMLSVLDLLFKHFTNVLVLLLGEIRCVKNVSISQFKIPSCEKYATSFGFICFTYLCNI